MSGDAYADVEFPLLPKIYRVDRVEGSFILLEIGSHGMASDGNVAVWSFYRLVVSAIHGRA